MVKSYHVSVAFALLPSMRKEAPVEAAAAELYFRFIFLPAAQILLPAPVLLDPRILPLAQKFRSL